MRFLATIQYDGSKYSGYQKQPGKKTIQTCLEEALETICHKKVLVHGSGRTDAKVHALGQKVHFDLDLSMTKEQVKKALNSLLPDDIYVKDIEEVSNNFHARFDVQKKTYEYILNIGEYNPIEKDYVYQFNQELSISKMKEASTYFLGTHDFRAFTTTDEKESYERTIYEITIEQSKQYIIFTFTGNGFLRYMVRNIVGTLIEVGEGKREPKDISNILKSKDRKQAGKKAPACGLYLKDVFY